MSVSYRTIADDLRKQIIEGRYAPGDTLPKITELQEQYGPVGYQTVRSAIALLEKEGLVEAVRRRGTIVRKRPERRRVSRPRQVYRDEQGYYFDLAAERLVALRPPELYRAKVPIDLASILGVEIGTEVVVRDQVMGDPESVQVEQLVTSYIPYDVALGTELEGAEVGPGGIYDRLEEMGHGPLEWDERVTSRMPSPEEAEALGMPTDIGIPLLRLVRTSTSPAGRVVEVNDTRMSAEEVEIAYGITRHLDAQPLDDGSTGRV